MAPDNEKSLVLVGEQCPAELGIVCFAGKARGSVRSKSLNN